MKPPAFQFYPDDFLGGTADMTTEEVGAYIRLLCHQWTKGGLPDDRERLMRMAGAMPVPSLGYVLAKFRLCEDGCLRNDRLEAERGKQAAYRASQSEKGQKGAVSRWKNGRCHSSAMPVPSSGHWPNDSSPSPSPSPSSSSTNTTAPAGQLSLDDLADLGTGNPSNLEAAHAQRASEEPTPRSAHPPSKRSQFHAAFMAGWCSGFEEVRGVKYDVCGGKDGSAVKRLSSTGRTVEDLLATARAAWVRISPPNWHCQKAVSIAYFAGFLNEIRAELTHAPTTHAKTHRNDFIAGAGTGPSTTEILRRRAEREAAERLSRAEQPVAG